jgi:hypothetical protein
MRINFTATVVAAGLCLIAGLANAATVTVTWTNPTTNTDGSALAASSITRTTLWWGTSVTALTNSKIVAGSATSATIDLVPGTWTIGAKTTANGNESDLSVVIQKVVPQPTPNPPVLTVQPVVAGINMSPAYKILSNGNRSSVVAGFVPLSTACQGPRVFTYREKSYHRVPRESVTWWKTTPTTEVAAPCA